MINRSGDDHPLHLHRHTFEVTNLDSKPMSGLTKDVLIVPANATAEVDFTADNPGATLFHCHQSNAYGFRIHDFVSVCVMATVSPSNICRAIPWCGGWNRSGSRAS
ncbi:MAG TPA: multicopper oxidase domain-containing protein [Terriglobales bacterium]|nr:multicopper oxidase domain-containing protein [Terriglobales bacterium]